VVELLTSLILSMLAAAVIPAGQSFSCTPTAVYDGDGPVWCAEGPRIRLAGIATREMDGTCRSNQPCPGVSAEQSRDQLVKLVGVPFGRRREGHVVSVGGKWQKRADGCLVRITARRRSVMRHGPREVGAKVGAVLEAAPVLRNSR
jgi:endonuclease YncB( thermonuclease family)